MTEAHIDLDYAALVACGHDIASLYWPETNDQGYCIYHVAQHTVCDSDKTCSPLTADPKWSTLKAKIEALANAEEDSILKSALWAILDGRYDPRAKSL